ncbi:MAG: hypothetical protein ACOC96_09635 [Actinomycetota bacterium]
MQLKMIVRLGSQAFAIGGLVKSLREARAEGDRLRMLDAAVHGLAIATTVALLVREIRQQREGDGE